MTPKVKDERLKRLMKCTLVLMFACILILFAFLWVSLSKANHRVDMQQALAKELGVEISNYPYPHSFPAGYFSTILKSDMPITDVHDVVRGYSQAYRCGKTRELYYFLSVAKEDAVRMWIFYDTDGKYKRLQVEDNDSGGLPKDDCQPGLLDE